VRVEGIRGQNLRLRIIEVNRYGGRLHLRWRSGLPLPESRMLEDLFDHFLILDESDDSYLTAALGTVRGSIS